MKTAQDGGKFVSLTQRPPLRPGNVPVIQLCYIYIYIYICTLGNEGVIYIYFQICKY